MEADCTVKLKDGIKGVTIEPLNCKKCNEEPYVFFSSESNDFILVGCPNKECKNTLLWNCKIEDINDVIKEWNIKNEK